MRILLIALGFVLAAADANAQAPAWRTIFNGRDLTGWSGAIQGYRVENGTLVYLKDGGGNLYFDEPQDDFALRFSFRTEKGGNNGVGIRAVRGKDAAYHGMEIQILDDDAPEYANLHPYQYHGSVYGIVAATRGALKPAGEWNKQEIRAEGSRIRITVNGRVVVDADLRAAVVPRTLDGKDHPGLFNHTGLIGFLGHGSRAEFRDIQLLEL